MDDRNRNEPVFMISVAAHLCHMHPQTLRLYERLGLVSPKRRNGRNRLYSEEDIARVQQIQCLTQDMGVNLAGVEVILGLLDRMKQLQTESERHLEEIRADFQAELNRLHKSSELK